MTWALAFLGLFLLLSIERRLLLIERWLGGLTGWEFAAILLWLASGIAALISLLVLLWGGLSCVM